MTHNEFNHIVAGLSALSPEQMEQLRRELENKLAMAARQAAGPALATSEVKVAARPKPIWEIIEEENRSIPPEVWDDLPTDLAEQHDHYIYGTPKRSHA